MKLDYSDCLLRLKVRQLRRGRTCDTTRVVANAEGKVGRLKVEIDKLQGLLTEAKERVVNIEKQF